MALFMLVLSDQRVYSEKQNIIIGLDPISKRILISRLVLEINEGILRNQKLKIGLDSFSKNIF